MVSLLDSLEVKGLTLGNRIVMPPMQTGLAAPDGTATSRLIEHYVARSKSLGLMIIEHSYVSPEGKMSERQLGIHNDNMIPRLERLSSSVHAKGTPVVIQLNHAGDKTSKQVTGRTPIGASAGEGVEELQEGDIENLVEAFRQAAARAIRGGFDGVEIHGAHGFLLNQFYSPLSNHRGDEYGGSLEGRMAFPLKVVKAIREEIDERLLLYRLGSDDLDPKGTRIEDSKKFARELEKASVDIIDVSGGLCGSRPTQAQGIQGYFIPQAQKIKTSVTVPVIGIGGITDPKLADEFVRTRKVDLVAIGRALLEDPQWVAKAIMTLQAN